MPTSKKPTTQLLKMSTSNEHRVDTDGQVSDSIIAITVMAQLHLMDVLLYPYGNVGEKSNYMDEKVIGWYR